MQNPQPVNITSDDHWRELGWPCVARDKDGHVVTMYAVDDFDDEGFREFLAECYCDDLTVTKLR